VENVYVKLVKIVLNPVAFYHVTGIPTTGIPFVFIPSFFLDKPFYTLESNPWIWKTGGRPQTS
jgi:hypothetical protein